MIYYILFLISQLLFLSSDLTHLTYVFHRFLFTDYNRLSSVGGETSMAEMIATLSDACEREFGFLAARLFRVFKTDEIQGTSQALSRGVGGEMAFQSKDFSRCMFMQNVERNGIISLLNKYPH